jgi:hypothetical protein
VYADCVHIGTLNEIAFVGRGGRVGPERSEIEPEPITNMGPPTPLRKSNIYEEYIL